MNFTLYTANCAGNPQNNLYPNRLVISNADDMRAAVAYDHVCAEFRNSRRNNYDFFLPIISQWTATTTTPMIQATG